MRIAVNTRFLLPGRLEGIGWFTHEVVKRLVARRPNDEFIFLFDRPFDASFLFSDQVTPLVVPPPARHPLLWYMWFEWALPYVLKKQRADVFLSPDGYCSLRSQVPTVMVIHDIAFRHYPKQIPTWVNYYYQYFVPRYLQRAEQVLTVSDFCRQDMIEAYQVNADKISVTCNGVRPHFIPISQAEQQQTKQAFSNGQDYFFYVGAIHPRKNLPRLIAAYDLFRQQTERSVKLLISGRFAWQTGDIQQAYQAATHREDIHFLGFVDDQDLPRLIGSALGLTYVSLFEGFGVPVLAPGGIRQHQPAAGGVVARRCCLRPDGRGVLGMGANGAGFLGPRVPLRCTRGY